ncbi:class I SAM-dependent methyltransferase [Chitinibacter sp. S2-10]|uniref:class I SAM-dependent methyltransferase n=1 Tax=Chitinibacter sp. S2-10 TaxID=3373597 RepID=UPI00397796BC
MNHWEQVYTSKSPDAVSWFQPKAAQSLAWIVECADKDSQIIDIGGGASTLVDDLLATSFKHLSVLDLSAAALKIVQQRLGEAAKQVNWLVGDITSIALPEHAYDVWHDRAVFHFLTEPAQRAAYRRQLACALKSNGQLIIATFAADGPEKCSGLPVQRYLVEQLAAEFAPEFSLIKSVAELHATPFGTQQSFIYCHFQRENQS